MWTYNAADTYIDHFLCIGNTHNNTHYRGERESSLFISLAHFFLFNLVLWSAVCVQRITKTKKKRKRTKKRAGIFKPLYYMQKKYCTVIIITLTYNMLLLLYTNIIFKILHNLMLRKYYNIFTNHNELLMLRNF